MSNEKPSFRIARFVTVTVASRSGFTVSARDANDAIVCVPLREGSNPSVIFDALAVKTFSDVRSSCPAFNENAPEFSPNVPEMAGRPALAGDMTAENLLPAKSDPAPAVIVSVPVNVLPESVWDRLIAFNETVGVVTARYPPSEIFPSDVVRLSNEKPSLRIARFVTVTDVSRSGLMVNASDAMVTNVCDPVACGSKARVIFDADAVKKFDEFKSNRLAVRLTCPVAILKLPLIAG